MSCKNPSGRRKCLNSSGPAAAIMPEETDFRWLQVNQGKAYVPADWRTDKHVLPEAATRKGTQLARTEELERERQQKLVQLVEESAPFQALQYALQDSNTELEKMAGQMASKDAELLKVRRERHSMMESKRQKSLTSWLSRPEGERENLRLPTRASHFDCSVLDSHGYSSTEIQRTFRGHVEKVEHFIEDLVSDPLKQLQLADAVSRRFSGIKSSMPRDNEAAEYVMESLRNFEATLRERFAGRYPNEIRAAHQAVSAAIMSKVPTRKVAVVAEATGFTYDSLIDGRHRWAAWFAGTEKQLTELRGKVRSDKMEEAWIEFAAKVWVEETRPAPSTKCSIRNPHDQRDKKLYRIHYLDVRIGDMLAIIQQRGKEAFPDAVPPFHFSWWYCIKVRPFFVKPAGRETSVCIYHLRFDLLVEALYVFYKRLRDAKVCRCSFPNIKYAADFRRSLVCEREESARYDKNECAIAECCLCGELQQLNICGCIDLDSAQWLIRWEEYQKIEYTRKDGSVKDKYDLVVVNTTFQQFLEHFAAYWRTFQIHHQTAKLQDDDIRYVKLNPQRGVVSDVEDFSENDHIQPKREHASRYFTEVGYTLFGMVLTGHLDDFANIGEDEREELRELFRLKKLPLALTESHIVISGDLTHDAAAVIHFNDKILTPYIKQNMTDIRKRIRITDGAPQHFKLADLALWTSGQQVQTGILSEHLFGATAHRKDLSDSECGGAKHVVHRVQMASREGETSKVKTPHDAFLTICQEYGQLTHARFVKQNKGVGIYRRFIYWVPAAGEGSINRNIQSCQTLATKELGGIKSLHQLCDVGMPGRLRVRQCSCHSCDACKVQRFDECVNMELLGPVETITLHPDRGNSVRMTRNALSEMGVSLSQQVREKEIIGVELEGENESFMLCQVLSASGPYTVSEGFESHMGEFKTGDVVLDVRKMEPTSFGSSMYEFTEKTFPIFVEDVRMRNMERYLENIDLSRRSARVAQAATSSNAPSQREIYALSAQGKNALLKLTAAGDAMLVDRRDLST